MIFGRTNINTKGYCIKCKDKREIINTRLETTPTGKSMIKGNCEICGCGMCKIVPATTNQKDLKKAVKTQEGVIKSEKEKQEVKEFVSKTNTPENKEKLSKQGYTPPMRKSYYNLIKFAIFLLAVAVAILFYRTYYPEEFTPNYNYNSTCEIDCGDDTISCPDCPSCPTCPSCPSVDCGDNVCKMPEDLNLNITDNN